MSFAIHLQPKQEQIYDLLAAVGPRVATIIGGGGAKGGGKSDGARSCALMLAGEFGAEYKGLTITIVRRTYKDLKKNHIDPLLRKHPELLPHYRAGDEEIRLGHARIVFMYAENEGDVKRKFLGGYESTYIIVDEAQQFSEQELMWISTAARWTDAKGIPEGLCKTLLLFNPGGPGSAYIKRVFWTRQYLDNETPHAYAFVHIFGWDNYEWFRGQVDIEEDPLDPDAVAFYEIEGKCVTCRGNRCCRYQIFITETSEGRKYNAFPESIRLGYLLGSFDKFSGQYYAEVWDERLCVLSMAQIVALKPYWWPIWLSSDYGMGHHWATYWFCIGKIGPDMALEVLGIGSPKRDAPIECRQCLGCQRCKNPSAWPLDIILCYHEFIGALRAPEYEVATQIIKHTPVADRSQVVRFVMGSDVNKTPRFSEHSILEMIEAVTAPAGLPRIQNANCGRDTRVVNARVLHEMLRRTVSMRSANPPQDRPGEALPLLLFAAECPRAIAAIPALVADEDNVEDVLKIDGETDDVYDALKYGTAEHARVKAMAPVEVRYQESIDSANTMQGKYMAHMQFVETERKRTKRGRRR
jgi:hypothetical protein